MRAFPATIRGPPQHPIADHGGGREPAVPAAGDGWMSPSLPRCRADARGRGGPDMRKARLRARGVKRVERALRVAHG